MRKETVVISVGGSLIAPPSGIDTVFLKKFKKIIETHLKKGYRFVIITGGGATARNYQSTGRKIADFAKEDLDWIGIHATRLNGHLLRSIFRKVAHPALIKSFSSPLPKNVRVLIAAGVAPGNSTDYVAVRLAKKMSAKKMVNFSDITHVYNKDPKKFKGAKPLKEISWHDFRKLLPKKWDPGIHAPLDPVAAKLGEKMKLEVAMIGGKKLEELGKYLSDKSFVGTRIA